MKRKKATKAAPMSLAWLRQVIDREWPDDAPAKGSIVAVAAYFIKSGDPDGRNVFPAIDTMARDLRLSRHTVLGVTKAMQAEGMLERVGKIRTGTINYRLRLEPVEAENVSGSASDSVPSSVSSSAQRGTLPTTYDRKGVGGGGEGSPDGNTPAAVATGSETGDIKTITTAVMIHDDRANHIITDFITAFDARFAKRERSSTVATQRLEPHNDKLRHQIITKIDAGWPQDHLIDRIIAGLPPDDRGINYLTGLVASKIDKVPDRPDHAARELINERQVVATAQLKLDEAERRCREAEKADSAKRLLQHQTDRRNSTIARYRQTLEQYGTTNDIDAEVINFVSWLDSTADEEPLERQAAWPLSKEWIEYVDTEIKDITALAKEAEQKLHEVLGELNFAHYHSGITDDDAERELEQIVEQAGVTLATMFHPRNVDQSITAIRSHIDKQWGDLMRSTGKTMQELANEKMSATVIDANQSHIRETVGDIW